MRRAERFPPTSLADWQAGLVVERSVRDHREIPFNRSDFRRVGKLGSA
jgi:hypothetical protein